MKNKWKCKMKRVKNKWKCKMQRVNNKWKCKMQRGIKWKCMTNKKELKMTTKAMIKMRKLMMNCLAIINNCMTMLSVKQMRMMKVNKSQI